MGLEQVKEKSRVPNAGPTNEGQFRQQGGRVHEHAGCFVCGDPNNGGLGLSFDAQPDGSVRTQFRCERKYQGYQDRMHGGVIAMILDDAMTNCLLQRGVTAVTGRISVGFRRVAELTGTAQVEARLVSRDGGLYRMEAEMSQAGVIVARADGKFLRTGT